MNADQRFDELARNLGYSFDGEIKIGGNYTPLVVDGDVAYVSGQVPRVGDAVVEVRGEAGRHTRTSVGVFQLPKNASVELDLIASIQPC